MPRRILISGLVALVVAAADNKPDPQSSPPGWISLFDGVSLNGWSAEGGAEWRVENEVLRADSGSYGWLRHRAPFADFELVAEFRTASNGNSGIFLRAAPGGSPHITGYELQIFDGHARYPTGSVVSHASAQGTAIRAGEWQRFHVLARGPSIEIRLDGKLTVAFRDGKALSGFFGLQYNPGKPIEFRNLRVRPLGLQPIFDGSTLRGWTTVEPPRRPGGQGAWSVQNGSIHVKNGPGQLETERVWQNFVLQAETAGTAGELFLRGTPGVWGTGVRTSEARQTDGALAQTVVANGREIHVWNNGIFVSTIQAETPAGPVSLRGTDAEYRNLRLAPLP